MKIEKHLNFVNLKTSFNPHNMFICKKSSEGLLQSFSLVKKCESIFGFSKLQGYGMKEFMVFLRNVIYLTGFKNILMLLNIQFIKIYQIIKILRFTKLFKSH